MVNRPEKRYKRAQNCMLYRSFLCACAVLVVPIPAEAFEISGGVSVGGLVAGIHPHLAVSPHAAIAWLTGSGLLLAAHEMFSIVPATNPHGAGVYSQTGAELGYAWESIHFSLGPTLAIYSMPACIPTGCRRVEGISPGIHAQTNLYLVGPLGLSIWGGVDWHVGDSDILSGKMTAMVVAGPVLRWRTK